MKKTFSLKHNLIYIIYAAILVITCTAFTVSAASVGGNELPVKPPEKEGYKEIEEGFFTRDVRRVRNLYRPAQIYDAITGGYPGGLMLDLSNQTRLLDGRTIDPKHIYGKVYFGPYPFELEEAGYTYKRFRRYTSILQGEATAFLDLDYLLEPSHNSEDWTDRGQIAVRVSLKYKTEFTDLSLGTYDVFARFEVVNGKFVKRPAIIEGPLVNMVRSNAPGWIVISFCTGEAIASRVLLEKGKSFAQTKLKKRHEIKITGLQPNTKYRYRVEIGNFKSRFYTFTTAPEPGKGKVVFAYSGDSREGVGGGGANFMGINYTIAERNANLAFRKNADVYIFGGDLMNGNTTVPDDFRAQMYAWKQAFSGFWHHRPVYACMGNHESLLRLFENPDGEQLRLDRWPYHSQSAEAVFADELVHPKNGPAVTDQRRPTYSENVYSFQYGPVKFIAFNNNYWIAKSSEPNWQIPQIFGGSPEGYIMKDQMAWLEKELAEGKANPTVKHIILFAQEPVFPNGGHVKDCMWYHGNNSVTAASYDSQTGKIKAEKEGIIDVRNRLARLVGNNKKVAAVLGSDEHSYHKILIDNAVPVGVPKLDDKDGYSLVCQDSDSCSPLTDLKHPTWYLVSGGSGAPYYAEEKTPWNAFWKKNPDRYKPSAHTSMKGCYYYSSQENVMIFTADETRISVTVYNSYGEVIDKIDSLTAVKK